MSAGGVVYKCIRQKSVCAYKVLNMRERGRGGGETYHRVHEENVLARAHTPYGVVYERVCI